MPIIKIIMPLDCNQFIPVIGERVYPGFPWSFRGDERQFTCEFGICGLFDELRGPLKPGGQSSVRLKVDSDQVRA